MPYSHNRKYLYQQYMYQYQEHQYNHIHAGALVGKPINWTSKNSSRFLSLQLMLQTHTKSFNAQAKGIQTGACARIKFDGAEGDTASRNREPAPTEPAARPLRFFMQGA
jgi:hypothetical protein